MLAKPMAMFTLGYSVCAILICFAIVLSSDFVLLFGDFLKSEPGFFFSVGANFLMGAVFYLAAPAVKFPSLFKFLSIWALLGGLFILFVLSSSWAGVIDSLITDNNFLYRTIGAPLSIIIYIFIIVACFPGKIRINTSAHET